MKYFLLYNFYYTPQFVRYTKCLYGIPIRTYTYVTYPEPYEYMITFRFKAVSLMYRYRITPYTYTFFFYPMIVVDKAHPECKQNILFLMNMWRTKHAYSDIIIFIFFVLSLECKLYYLVRRL